MKFALSTFAFAISSMAMAEQNACNFTKHKVCVESEDFDLAGECGQHGGTMMVECSTANRRGSCEIKDDGATMHLRYYNGFPMSPEKHCADNEGAYTPN